MTAPKAKQIKVNELKPKIERDAKGRFVKHANAKAETTKLNYHELKINNAVTAKKDAAAEVKAILKAATPEAAGLLIQIMLDEERPLSTRLDCANKIIERVCGKAGQNSDTAGNEVFKIVLTDEVKKYAK